MFTRHAHLIEVAARTAGGDPNMNAGLRMAIENARADNLPGENIDRAIKKGTGELKGEVSFQEVSYEGFGPGGVAFIVDTLTDNKNRTSQSVRTIFQKQGGNMGSMGSTSFLFDIKGEVTVRKKNGTEADELELIDAGADDLEDSGDSYVVYTQPGLLAKVRDAVSRKDFVVKSAELVKIAKTLVDIADKTIVDKITELLEALDEDDDVTNVWVNGRFE